MAETCEVAGPGARCKIQVLGYENPAAQNPSDANWLSCRVFVKSDSLSAEARAAFSVQDFGDFAQELGIVMRHAGGTASFHTDEEVLSLKIDVSKTGTAVVSGVLRLAGSLAAAISFSYETDQTFLSDTQRQLEVVGRAFPARLGSTPA